MNILEQNFAELCRLAEMIKSGEAKCKPFTLVLSDLKYYREKNEPKPEEPGKPQPEPVPDDGSCVHAYLDIDEETGTWTCRTCRQLLKRRTTIQIGKASLGPHPWMFGCQSGLGCAELGPRYMVKDSTESEWKVACQECVMKYMWVVLKELMGRMWMDEYISITFDLPKRGEDLRL